ncbi:MAG: polysaccharide biosynthesis protein PslG [Solirubrobacterales bacterium]|nr:polysaccharide biosynthesis protein PslG [Solirubrobacterales bacterium]
MRTVRSTAVVLASLAASLVAVPTAGASQAGDTEHGVNRAKLIATAEKVVEERDGIDVLKISKCGPQKRHGKLNYSTWICLWRAQGTYADGDIDYACAGKAVYKRKSKTWVVDKCENTRQPMAPLLSTPNPPPTFGFNDDWIFQSVTALDLLDDSGADVARTSLPWGGVEPTKGASNWYGSDVLYQRLLDRGIKPLWVLIGTPCFAQADPAGCASGDDQLHPSPAYYDEMAQFAVTAAKRYPQSAGFEVWNEPNYPKYWGGPPDPAAYSEMLKTVADALHDQVPGMTVVSGGLSPHSDGDTSGAIGFRDFLIDMYERGAAQKADAIGIHPYPGVGPGEDYLTDVRVYLGKIENVMDRYNDSSRPLWATEFGVSTAGDTAFSPEAAGQAITELLDMFRHIRGIQLAIVHRFVENPALGGREAGFGMLNKNLTPKPAFCDLAALRGYSVGVC